MRPDETPNRTVWPPDDNVKTYFVGASCSSISPLMKVAMLPAAALVSSAVFEIESLLRSSSSTLTDFWFSDFVFAAFDGADSITSADGMIFV